MNLKTCFPLISILKYSHLQFYLNKYLKIKKTIYNKSILTHCHDRIKNNDDFSFKNNQIKTISLFKEDHLIK